MNIFSGARRIAAVIYLCGSAAIATTWYNETLYPDVRLTFSTTAMPKVEESRICFSDQVTEDRYFSLESTHHSVNLRVCFDVAKDSSREVVTEHAGRLVGEIDIVKWEPELRPFVEAAATKRLKEYFYYFLTWTGASLALTLTTGWIVRGFMGIPMGKDSKPSG